MDSDAITALHVCRRAIKIKLLYLLAISSNQFNLV